MSQSGMRVWTRLMTSSLCISPITWRSSRSLYKIDNKERIDWVECGSIYRIFTFTSLKQASSCEIHLQLVPWTFSRPFLLLNRRSTLQRSARFSGAHVFSVSLISLDSDAKCSALSKTRALLLCLPNSLSDLSSILSKEHAPFLTLTSIMRLGMKWKW